MARLQKFTKILVVGFIPSAFQSLAPSLPGHQYTLIISCDPKIERYQEEIYNEGANQRSITFVSKTRENSPKPFTISICCKIL